MRKRSDGLATIEIVLAHARRELEESGPVKFNLDRVIESSGISRSSVYHHFGNRAGLLATVRLEKWVESQRSDLNALYEFLIRTNTIDELMKVVEFTLRRDKGADSKERRLRRISTLVDARRVPALSEILTESQRSGSRRLAEAVADLKKRGVVSDQVDPSALAYFFQSLLVGRVVVDSGDEPGVDTAWVSMVCQALQALLDPASHENGATR